MMSPECLYNISIMFHTYFMTCHIHSTKMEWDRLNAPHSNRCKGPISPCQSIQGWNDVLFMYLYGWVDILIRVVSIFLKCNVVFPNIRLLDFHGLLLPMILIVLLLLVFLPLCFGHELNLCKICLANSILHFFDPKTTYKHPKSTFGLFQQRFKNITMPTNKLNFFFNFNCP